jgi:hypothetical protein
LETIRDVPDVWRCPRFDTLSGDSKIGLRHLPATS